MEKEMRQTGNQGYDTNGVTRNQRTHHNVKHPNGVPCLYQGENSSWKVMYNLRATI